MTRRAAVATLTMREFVRSLGIPPDVEFRDMRIDWMRNRVEILLQGSRFPVVEDNCEPFVVPLSDLNERFHD